MAESVDILTPAQMADYLKIAKRSLLRMAEHGDIPAIKVAGQWRFLRSVIDDWLIGHMKALPNGELENLIESEKLSVPLPALLRPELVRLRMRPGDPKCIASQLTDVLAEAGLLQQRDLFLGKLLEREEMVSTAIFPGVAIPHLRRPEQCPLSEPRVALGLVPEGVDFHSLDGAPTYAFFLICAKHVVVHLKIIAELALLFRRPRLVEEMLQAPDVPALLQVLFSPPIDRAGGA